MAQATRVLLTIITVVYNDWPGLERTLDSVARHRCEGLEHWIIDGSSDGMVMKALADNCPPRTHLVSEPDDGLYDAMNKGLERAHGDYVIFLNAGDVFHEQFTLNAVRAVMETGRVLLGYSVEQWGSDGYLRPGLGHELDALKMPAHQATFYPRAFYRESRYLLSRPIGADGVYTAQAVRACGAIFIPAIVCRFELGGRSTRYDMSAVRARMREYREPRGRAQLLVKAALWAVLPQRHFYRLMARGKFTRLRSESHWLLQEPIALTEDILVQGV